MLLQLQILLVLEGDTKMMIWKKVASMTWFIFAMRC